MLHPSRSLTPTCSGRLLVDRPWPHLQRSLTRRYGRNPDICEQTAELREVGAAVAMSANATRFFEQFGLGSQLASRWFEVSALIY